MRKVYHTYDELNHDLKIVRLKMQIHKEEIRLTKERLKEDISPVTLISEVAATVAKKAFILKMVSKLVGITRAKIVKK